MSNDLDRDQRLRTLDKFRLLYFLAKQVEKLPPWGKALVYAAETIGLFYEHELISVAPGFAMAFVGALLVYKAISIEPEIRL